MKKINNNIPRGIRNNNPLNIERSKSKWQGLAEHQRDPRFAQFKSMTWGIRAAFNNVPDVTGAVAKLVAENTEARKKLEEFAKAKAAAFAKELTKHAENINGTDVVTFQSDCDPVMFREAAALLQKEVSNFALCAAFAHDGKLQLVLMYSQDLVAGGRNAAADIREAAKFIQGGGGGQPFLATAGGRDTSGLPAALDKMVEKATS